MDIATLLAECSHIQEDWPPIDDMTIYVHIMTNLDATHTDVEDAATYVGQSGNVRRRIWYHEKEIERAGEADPGNAPPKQNPSHYDIAPLTPSGHSHWIAAVSADIHRKLQHVDLGPHLALFMLEQTIIVLLGSYAPWLAGRQAYGSPTGWFVGAKTMTGAAERVRTRTGLPFPCVWPLVRGTNVSSPILRPHTGARYEGCASEIQAIYIPGPAHRPTSPGRHVYRFPRKFFKLKLHGGGEGLSTQLNTHVGGGKSRTVRIYVPGDVAAVIVDSIDPRFKNEEGNLRPNIGI